MLLSGTDIAAAIQQGLKHEVEQLMKQGIIPTLCIFLVGDNPASRSYIRAKARLAQKLSIEVILREFPKDVTEHVLLESLEEANDDDAIDGIIVQMPLPAHLDTPKIIAHVAPSKDVDGFHYIGSHIWGKSLSDHDFEVFRPCTPAGIIAMLEAVDCSPRGKHVVIVGRSDIVGKPLAHMLLERGAYADATVTVCHSQTENLAMHTSQADILVVAVGKPHVVKADMVKDGAVVIDVGISRNSAERSDVAKAKLIGDVDFEAVKAKASYITPVPGGVGPMTVIMLMKNTIAAASRKV